MDLTDKPMEVTNSQVLKDGSAIKDKFKTHAIAQYVEKKFSQWSKDRIETEKRWLKSYYNYRALYGKEVQFLDTEKSKVFIKITKTKVIAAYSQILDVLFSSSSDLPFTIDPKRLPDNIADVVHIDTKDAAGELAGSDATAAALDGIGFEGDGQQLKAGETFITRIGSYLEKVYENLKVKAGAAEVNTDIQVEPALVMAKRAEKKIKDQLKSNKVDIYFRKALLEMVILGTGIMKGPLIEEKRYYKWNEDGTYEEIIKVMPKCTRVSPWNFYTDRFASSLEDSEGVIERHAMTMEEFLSLKNKPMFRESAIDAAIEKDMQYEEQWWEKDLKENDTGSTINRFCVLEFWGAITVKELKKDFELDLPEDLRDLDQVAVNIWTCNGEVLRLVINPFIPQRIPYYVIPYEEDPYNVFGVGLPENMEDAQTLMNGFARMSVDNAVLSGSVILEVDEENLVAGTSYDLYPGKIFRRAKGQVGQSVFPINIPNISQANLQMFDRFRQLADEETGLPSYSHGYTGVTGMTRTASGMSMLFGAASLNVKTVIKNIDDYFIQPLAEAMYHFNNQYDFDKDMIGDFEILAAGTRSLMQKEVKSQRLLQFMQVSSNPIVASFVNFEAIIRNLAEVLELDGEKLLLDPKKRQAQAALIAQTQQQMQPQQPQAGGAPSVNDAGGGGGGNIGVGNPAMPQTEQFSANNGV